jgi:hypothetical protein
MSVDRRYRLLLTELKPKYYTAYIYMLFSCIVLNNLARVISKKNRIGLITAGPSPTTSAGTIGGCGLELFAALLWVK